VHHLVRRHVPEVRGVVLDLRGNPGGLLEEAVGVSSVFLDGGLVATTEGINVPRRRFEAARGRYVRVPLVVAVDGGTASSAEVVAAALAERRQAPVVGTPTYGKTSVQELVPLAYGGALRVTVAHLRTPSGRDLRGLGLEPTVFVTSRHAVARAVALAARR
jgi:carboxyl-terminal processing protease